MKYITLFSFHHLKIFVVLCLLFHFSCDIFYFFLSKKSKIHNLVII